MLTGLPANGTITAEVAFMFAEWYRPGELLLSSLLRLFLALLRLF
jgi:hypothetical protein